MQGSQFFCHFLNASQKSCSVMVFSTACDSASVTSVVSIWQETRKVARGHASRVGHVVFWSGRKWWQRKCETVHCHDAAASSFVTRIQGKVFAHFHSFAVKRHSSMQNWLFSLPGRILCENPLDVKGNYEYALCIKRIQFVCTEIENVSNISHG
jgi:hypothetical protein